MLIGWSAADITPDRPTNLRGQFHTRISQYVNDPLTATALALEGEEGQAVLVSCDLVGAPGVLAQRLHEMLRPRLPDLDVRKLVLNGTHTHTAPDITEGHYPPLGPEVMTPAEYADLFCARVADAVVEAWEARKPGGVSWAYGHAVVGHNRRASYLDGRSVMYGATEAPDFAGLEGYEDHGLDLLFTWDEAGALTGLIVNLACPSQETEGVSYTSADFWHETRVELRRRLGEGLFVLPQCSAAGDQSPHLLVHKQAEARMLELRGLTGREEIARRIGRGVEDVVDLAQRDILTDPILRHAVADIGLPIRRVTDEEHAQSQARVAELEAQPPDPNDAFARSHHFIMLRRNKKVIARYEEQDAKPLFDMELHCLRIDDIAIATNPFELFLDYGLRIKARSPAVQTFVVQIASAGPNSDGTYLPTARALAARSYGAEAVDNTVGPEGGQTLVEETLRTLGTLWEGR
ncbi:MAG: hypothetical protein FJX74_11055 [Armatimonadetes bacterium]|nr:hypothetical protein [Armatimonadota bacterium]